VPDVSGRSLADLWSLAGRRAVITGGAKGIGRAIAERFAEAGAAVALGDLDLAAARTAASAIEARHRTPAFAFPVEMAESESVASLADTAVAALGGLDIWVNNAGIYPSAPFLEIDHHEWDRVIAVNVRGYFAGAQQAARLMVAAGRGGVIVNISSTGAVKAAPGVAHYITSKHGVVGITKALAVELAPYEIRVLSIAPSMTHTEGRVAFLDRYTTPEVRALITEMESRVPLGRVGVADDVARAALFAACDMSMLMTGSILFVDSGESAL
jgi:NAD(P)-dependent dehydrogenase (short-subunit alcohol dehydrogenase family)